MASPSDLAASLKRLLGKLSHEETEFLVAIGQRLVEGRVYGDPTARPLPVLLDELLEEQLDQVGWVYPMFRRTQALKRKAQELDPE